MKSKLKLIKVAGMTMAKQRGRITGFMVKKPKKGEARLVVNGRTFLAFQIEEAVAAAKFAGTSVVKLPLPILVIENDSFDFHGVNEEKIEGVVEFTLE